MKNNQKGFHVWFVALIIVILGMIGGIGYFIASKNSDSKNTAKTEPSSSTIKSKSEVTTPKTTEYCDPYWKSCFSYSDDWTKAEETKEDIDLGEKATLITLKHNSIANLSIRYRSAMGGVGGGCSTGEIVGLTDTKNSAHKVVEQYTDYEEVENGNIVGSPKYYLGMSVTSNRGQDEFRVGTTDCMPLGLFSYPSKTSSDETGTAGSMSAVFTKEYVNSVADAKTWFRGDEANAVREVLKTFEIR